MVRLPIPPVEIALGSIFAYVGFITSNQYFNIIAEIGFLYLMFLAGMEVDLKQISRSSKTVIQKSILFIFLMSFFAVSMGMMFPSQYDHHYLHASYLYRSTRLSCKELRERGILAQDGIHCRYSGGDYLHCGTNHS